MDHYQIYNFNGQDIEFDITGSRLMINATEMAKIYDKKPEAFLRNEVTKAFISECLKSENSRYLAIESEDDLVTTKQRSGTWMHRILALKFAAWLNPAFELWVYSTIDQVLFSAYRSMEESLKHSASRKNRIDQLKNALLVSDEYRELEQLELEERQAAYRRGKDNKYQLDLFRQAGIESPQSN